MPPKGQPQPTAAERQQIAEWIGRGLEVARLRPAPKMARPAAHRSAVSEHPPRVVAYRQRSDGRASSGRRVQRWIPEQRDTLQLSPLLMEAYFDIAEKALDHAIVDPDRSRRFRTSVSIWARESIPRRCPKSSYSEPEVSCWKTRTFW